MLVSQISVFVDNCPGRVQKVTETLAAENINIKALVIVDGIDFSVIRLIVNDPEKALSALRREGLTASKIKLIGIKIENYPGAINRIFSILSECAVNIEYCYSFCSYSDTSFIILRVSDTEEVARTLESCGVEMLSDDEVCASEIGMG